ncbi:hypothetical protein Ahu01nite_032740 [Winogradskya humida]|uniref:Uncharacterized protein n=1 Tax=Winogradskya humida TaxID=113566 RepID=A0ABQ3ZNP7_9ACTN|nr:hypothetical protein Ahu01nite_032740 [Actinoplanes humidus]
MVGTTPGYVAPPVGTPPSGGTDNEDEGTGTEAPEIGGAVLGGSGGSPQAPKNASTPITGRTLTPARRTTPWSTAPY